MESIPNDYQQDYNAMIEELENLLYDCNDKAREIANKYGMLKENDYNIFCLQTYRLGNDNRRQKRRELENKLKAERDNKIAQIILDLELGETTKQELNDILNNIKF